MLVIGNINFQFDSLKKAIENRTLIPDEKYVALYLFEKNDHASYLMIKNNGNDIQSKLKFDLFTFFDKATFELMGWFPRKKRVAESLLGLFPVENTIEWQETDSDIPFEKMKKIGDEYGVKRYPAIVIINTEESTVNFKKSYHVIEIEKEKFVNGTMATNYGLAPYHEASIIYRYFFEPFMTIVAKSLSKNIFFSDLIKKLDFSKNYNLINKELELENKFDNYEVNNVRIFIQQGNKSCIDRKGNRLKMDDFTDKALNITADAYGRRFTRNIGFTRDELICIALFLGFSYMELNRLIELYNNAFKNSPYRFINGDDSRDDLFLKLMSTGQKYNYKEINTELRKNREAEISLLNS